MSDLYDRHQQHRERREERHEQRGHGDHYGEDTYDSRGQQRRHRQDDDQQGGYGGYTAPPGSPPAARDPSALGSLGGLDRGDFASDADIDRLVKSGRFNGKQEGYGGEREDTYGRYGAPSGPPPGRGNEHGRYDAPSGPPQGYGRGKEYGEYDAPSGPPTSQGYGGRYDAPSGPPPGRGYQGQQPRDDYGPGGGDYGGPDRRNQYESRQPQGRPQYDSPQAPQSGYGRNQGNAPGGFGALRDGEDQYRSGYEPPRRGEATSYYNQQGTPGQGDRYSHLARIAQEHGNDDPEVYRQATQGLQDRIQAQTQSRRPNDEDDYSAHVDAHRKAYGDDNHGPMDADAIGSAAAMEAIKQTAAAAKSSNAPAGGFMTGGAGSSSKVGRVAQEETADADEGEETTAARAGASGGLQDKLMALAMSHAGKLFDKKNAGASGGDQGQDKAQAMQSAAATAMQMFSKYQSGKLDASDMSSVMGLAKMML